MFVLGVAAAIFILTIPILVFGANSLALLFDPGFYSQGQIQQRVDEVYGLPQEVLVPVNRGVVRYFGSDRETLAESLAAEGADPSFYNERETVHMADVHSLVRLILTAVRVGLVYGILFMVAAFALLGTKAVGHTGTYLIVGSVVTVAVVVVGGALTVTNFSDLFLRFHLLSFSNDFWQLDPRTDRLVQMFPFGFWYNAMLALVIRSMLTTLAVAILGGFFVWLGRRLL